jgi:Ca2+-binding RTX toxin-like protein
LHFVFQQSGPGGTTLTGTVGKDIIFSTGGDDTLSGLAGRDNFIFGQAFGHDTITDFTPGTDVISVNIGSFASVGAILAAAQTVGQDVVITADANDTITLKNVTIAELTAHQGDFHIS